MNQKTYLSESEEEKFIKTFHRASTVHLSDEEISVYLEGKGSLFTRSRVEAHITQCEFCRDELQMLNELRQEGPGELEPKVADQIQKLLSYIRPHVPAKASKPSKGLALGSILLIGRLDYQFAALSTQAKTASDWAEPKDEDHDEDKYCVWAYRENDQRDLIFKFTVYLPEPKAVQLEAAGQIWEAPLKPEGNEWITEVTISAQERARLQSGDDIHIRVING